MTAGRQAMWARTAAVATGHPLATAAALRTLYEGGNAADAAIAAAGVLSVVLPDMCGVGGDVFALVFDPHTGRVTALNGSGRAASQLGNLTRARPAEHTGPRLATVPGAVRAWADLLARFGTRSLRVLLRPAIDYASGGFPIGHRLALQIARYQPVLSRDPATSAVFLPGGRAPERGELLPQAGLAATLEQVADHGPDSLYTGSLAARLAGWCHQRGGHLSEADFAQQHSIWTEPLVGTYRGLTVCVSPPVSQALLLLLQAAMLAGDDLAKAGHNSGEAVHLMVECKKRAFAARDRYLGDPDLVAPFPPELLSPGFAREQRATVTHEAFGPDRLADSQPAHANTTYLAVVDAQGMAVSLIQSIFNDWGCGSLAADTGILLNDRLLGFSWDPSSPNHVAPAKRPVHTLSPSLILDDGALRMVLGTPGADAQVQTLMQLLVNLLDHGMELQAAIDAPRWRSGSEGDVLLERRVPVSTAEDLTRRGHHVVWGADWDTRTGGAQAILLDPRSGSLQAAADPRREGTAAGY
ncbi:MAG TPA: gamma-glutamyltransferase family protein [Chloroflexota bacterium]